MKHTKKIGRRILLGSILALLLITLTVGGIALYYKKTHYANITLSARGQTETNDNLNTPESGWYQLYAYRLTPNTPLGQSELYLEETDEQGIPYRLALLEFNLSYYREEKLDSAAKENIQKVLEQFSHTKAKMIIRFLYDWDGFGETGEPQNLSIIQKHMRQAGKLLNPYKDYIYTTQGIFVGSWGEMHGSKYLSSEDMTTLLLTLASATDDSIYLAVRTPKQYRTILKELTNHPEKYEKYSISTETLTKRLGLFNDGMMGSVSDVGTYQKADDADSDTKAAAIRKKELAFQDKLCRSVPNGGEVVTDNPYNDWENAIKDLRTMHVSYLNLTYDEQVIEKWKNSTYTGEDNLYDGMSAYDYITRHFGARLVLTDCVLNYKPYQKGAAKGTVTLKNVGFSHFYTRKVWKILLENTETGKEHTLLSSEDLPESFQSENWKAGDTITLPLSVAPFSYEAGKYNLYFQMYDPVTDETILFANDSFVSEKKAYHLGSILIEHE